MTRGRHMRRRLYTIARNQMIGVVAGGVLLYAFLEFGALTGIAILFIAAPIAAAVAWIIDRRRVDAAARPTARRPLFPQIGDTRYESAGPMPTLPFGATTARRLPGATLMPGGADSEHWRPRFFQDPLTVPTDRSDAAAEFAETYENLPDFELRQEFEESLEQAELELAESILFQMAHEPENYNWCLNAARRLQFHRRIEQATGRETSKTCH